MRTEDPASWTTVAQELAEAIRRTPGFWFVPVELPDEGAARALVGLLGDHGVQAKLWAPDGAAWLDLGSALASAPPPGPSPCHVVYGRSPLTPDQIRGLSFINQMRDTIVRALGCPLIWCGPRAFLSDCWQAMPDVWSVRGGEWRLPSPGEARGDRGDAVAFRSLPQLNELLLHLFESNELRRFLRSLPDGEALLARLPPSTATSRQLTQSATALLSQHGMLDRRFFEELIRVRPRRQAEIRAVAGPRMSIDDER